MSAPIAAAMFIAAQLFTLVDCRIKKSWKPMIILYVAMMNVYNLMIAYFLFGK